MPRVAGEVDLSCAITTDHERGPGKSASPVPLASYISNTRGSFMSDQMTITNQFGCVQNTIRLRSGRYFDFIDPKPEQFELGDIAGALSKICRFGGQCPQFYSVAEHSVHCAWQAFADSHPPDVCMAVLFHDAAEAFCGDVVKPLKIMLTEYSGIEDRVEKVIGDSLGIDFAAHSQIIREIDHAMLIAERRSIFSADGVAWFGENDVRRLNVGFHFWQPDMAEVHFLRTAEELSGEYQWDVVRGRE